jgi:hypothetical protein
VSETELNNEEQQPEGLLATAMQEDVKEEVVDPEENIVPHKVEEDTAEPEVEKKEIPEGIEAKFIDEKTGEVDISKLNDSYKAAQKKISMGGHKAPDKYDFSLLDDVEDDDPLKTFVTDWIQENRPTQEAVDTLVGTFLELSDQQAAEETIDNDAELKKLGPKGSEMVKGTLSWARGLKEKGILGDDDMEEISVFAATADGISTLTKIRRYYEGPTIPTAPTNVEGLPSEQEFYEMVKDPKYKTDPAYRRQVEAMAAKLFPGMATTTG